MSWILETACKFAEVLLFALLIQCISVAYIIDMIFWSLYSFFSNGTYEFWFQSEFHKFYFDQIVLKNMKGNYEYKFYVNLN